MSNLNINKHEWLELVFEGKNKEYGAYQLRKENDATTAKAFVSALVFITGLVLLPVLLSSFKDKPKPIVNNHIDDGIKVTEVVLPEKKEEPKKTELPIQKTAAQKPITVADLNNLKVVEASKAKNTELPKPEDVGKPVSNTPNPTGTETGVVTTPPIVGTGTPANTGNGDIIATTNMVEKNPMYPGGIEEFLKTVGRRFQSPEIDEEKTIRIIVFFVVEKDGTLSNITVPRNPGYDLDKEAIRVLKSIKTKWEPGIYKGEPVRTQYSLPILVKTQ